MTDPSLRPPGDRTIVITGAGRGLGLGLATRLAAAGDRVIGTARRPDTAAELAAVADRVIALDVADDASISAAVDAVADLDHIDVLINNAGIDARAVGAEAEARGPLDLGRADFLAVLDVNAVGPLLVTRALLPQLRAAEGAVVLNVSSQLGAMTFGHRGGRDIAYNASKSALNMVTVRTATELEADGVALIALHPGWVQTDMGGSAATLTIDESTQAIVETLGRLTLADTGRFIRWDGTTHDW